MRVVRPASTNESYRSAWHGVPGAMMVAAMPAVAVLAVAMFAMVFGWIPSRNVAAWVMVLPFALVLVLISSSVAMKASLWHRWMARRSEVRWMRVRALVFAEMAAGGAVVDRDELWRRVRRWMRVPVTQQRRVLLIQAGVPVGQARSWPVLTMRSAELETMRHLRMGRAPF